MNPAGNAKAGCPPRQILLDVLQPARQHIGDDRQMNIRRHQRHRVDQCLDTLLRIDAAKPDDERLVGADADIGPQSSVVFAGPVISTVADDERRGDPVMLRIPLTDALADRRHGIRLAEDGCLLPPVAPLEQTFQWGEARRQSVRGEFHGIVDQPRAVACRQSGRGDQGIIVVRLDDAKDAIARRLVGGIGKSARRSLLVQHPDESGENRRRRLLRQLAPCRDKALARLSQQHRARRRQQQSPKKRAGPRRRNYQKVPDTRGETAPAAAKQRIPVGAGQPVAADGLRQHAAIQNAQQPAGEGPRRDFDIVDLGEWHLHRRAERHDDDAIAGVRQGLGHSRYARDVAQILARQDAHHSGFARRLRRGRIGEA